MKSDVESVHSSQSSNTSGNSNSSNKDRNKVNTPKTSNHVSIIQMPAADGKPGPAQFKTNIFIPGPDLNCEPTNSFNQSPQQLVQLPLAYSLIEVEYILRAAYFNFHTRLFTLA